MDKFEDKLQVQKITYLAQECEIPPQAPEGICPYCLLGEGFAIDETVNARQVLHRDDNLLFVIFAVQLKRSTPAKLIKAAASWATDPSEDLIRDEFDQFPDVMGPYVPPSINDDGAGRAP